MGHVKHTVIRNAYKISIRKPEGKKPNAQIMCRWENKIKIDTNIVSIMERTHVALRRGTVTISCVHGNELSDLIRLLAFQEAEGRKEGRKGFWLI
jgi:hypothetical protein